jgi:hypothetical protein
VASGDPAARAIAHDEREPQVELDGVEPVVGQRDRVAQGAAADHPRPTRAATSERGDRDRDRDRR